MKILQVCPRYYPSTGGVEEHVRNISERLAKRYYVSISTTDSSGRLPKEEIVDHVKIMRFKSWAPNEAYYFSRELKKYLSRNSDSFDIVHAHSYHALPALYAAQARNRNKLFFTPHYHGGGHTFFRQLLHMPYRFFGKKIFQKADKIICVSNHESSLISKNFRIADKKITVISNAINSEEFEDLEKKEKDFRVVLYVGRLEKYKGVHYLVKALPKLDADIILEIVGKGPYKKNLVKLTRKLGVERRVRFNQDLPRRKLLKKYAIADLFVLLSKHEAYGITVAEALTSKTPCIVANTSALEEWVDSKNCFGIDYPIALDRLVRLINEVIGKEIEGPELPNWDDVVKQLVRVYDGMSYS